MKQTILFTKTIVSVLFFQLVFVFTINAQGWPPIKNNWEGLSYMSLSDGGGVCITPDITPDVGFTFSFMTLVYFANNNFSGPEIEPVYLYYNLPNGETGIQGPITSASVVTEQIRETFNVPEGIDYYAFFVWDVCFPECFEYSFCTEMSTQLVKNDLGVHSPYPMGNDLFPTNMFECDPSNLAYHYSEYKEICCPGIAAPPPGSTELLPCESIYGPGSSGAVRITEAPRTYSYNPSPCDGVVNGRIIDPNDLESVTAANAFNENLKQTREIKADDYAIFPNPANSNVTVQYTLNESGFVTYEWLDTQGRTIDQLEQNILTTGNYAESFNISSWQPGIYFLKISTPDGVKSLRFIKSAD
ncbi:MAG: T9SS type A sorting domain-containing protein [Bacteroidota bacterium]